MEKEKRADFPLELLRKARKLDVSVQFLENSTDLSPANM